MSARLEKLEAELEAARERVHGPSPTEKDRAEFKRLSKELAEERTGERIAWEAEQDGVDIDEVARRLERPGHEFPARVRSAAENVVGEAAEKGVSVEALLERTKARGAGIARPKTVATKSGVNRRDRR